MLQRSRAESQFADEPTEGIVGGDFNIDYYLAVAKRRARPIAACVLLSALLGMIYLATAVPYYTAGVRILIDSPEGRSAQELSGINEIAFDTSAVDSQVELVRSEAIAAQVVEMLDLVDNPLFTSNEGSLFGIIGSWIRGFARIVFNGISFFLSILLGQGSGLDSPPASPDGLSDELLAELNATKEATEKLRENLDVRRVARTYVLDIAYTSPSPTLAAQIANGYANAYINDQLESKYDATRRASEWLLNRTEELKQQSIDAELAVEAFRKENDLIATSGTLISDQQLSGLSGELILARADVSKIEARFARLKAIIDSGDTSAVVSETLSQSITSDLRARYLEANKKQAEISALLGANHAQAVRLRNEMAQLQRLMFEEMKRVTEVTRSDLEVARERVKALERDLTSLVGTTNEANETLIQLRELERNAESVRSLYTTFLQRYQESLQTQSFSISDARIITRAEPPKFPSRPQKARSLLLALFMGGAFGVGLAALFEYRDRAFRTGEQIRDELGLEFIGMLPVVEVDDDANKDGSDQQDHPPAQSADVGKSGDRVSASGRVLFIDDPVMTHATNNPLSGFAETLRASKVAADLMVPDKSSKVIGIVSVLPNEGKSTTAKNLSSLIAAQGSRVLLIDGDIRNPGLTRACAPDAENGLLEVIIEGADYPSVLRIEHEVGLFFLPTVRNRRISHTSDLMSSPGMRALLRDAASRFNYVIIDLPPLGPVVDVRAMLPLLDCVLFVIEWGKTNRRMVQNTLLEDHRLFEITLGAVLNKVDKNKLKVYENYNSKSYYYSSYSKYYQS